MSTTVPAKCDGGRNTTVWIIRQIVNKPFWEVQSFALRNITLNSVDFM